MNSEEYLNVQKMSQVEIDRTNFEYWGTPAGETELIVRDLCRVADEMTDAAKHRDGVQTLRKQYAEWSVALQKIIDIKNDLAPFVIVKAD